MVLLHMAVCAMYMFRADFKIRFTIFENSAPSDEQSQNLHSHETYEYNQTALSYSDDTMRKQLTAGELYDKA